MLWFAGWISDLHNKPSMYKTTMPYSSAITRVLGISGFTSILFTGKELIHLSSL